MIFQGEKEKKVQEKKQKEETQDLNKEKSVLAKKVPLHKFSAVLHTVYLFTYNTVDCDEHILVALLRSLFLPDVFNKRNAGQISLFCLKLIDMKASEVFFTFFASIMPLRINTKQFFSFSSASLGCSKLVSLRAFSGG
jgi:hypothetical protein